MGLAWIVIGSEQLPMALRVGLSGRMGAVAPQTEHLPMGRALLLQPQAQRLADRLGPRQAALTAAQAGPFTGVTQTATLMLDRAGPRKDPATGGSASGRWETATAMWSGPARAPVVGSNPVQPAPGR
jgi:hypothetical protein